MCLCVRERKKEKEKERQTAKKQNMREDGKRLADTWKARMKDKVK